MLIFNSNGTKLVNSEAVTHYTLSDNPDAVVIMAGMSNTGSPPVSLERYGTLAEAKEALAELAAALSSGGEVFYMPMSVLRNQQERKRDARVKRRGGS
ncbi:MAG: hypothetical protein IJ773_03950 [Lachnospiraceae bacterium]|nr:hypothetical protein [Acidaminococcaceae bacterium]MBQ9284652.1 hypothetical protein [Acidaminococcaceae bacterium]MBR1812955.1 hypothetical protein [Lachnospiraceae bacterium]